MSTSPPIMYLVLDCYPEVGSGAFEKFVGAAVGCWVRMDHCASRQGAEDLAEDKLSAEGWGVARLLLSEQVSSDTYETKREGREHLEQAKIDGFVAHFHLRRRESIGDETIGRAELSRTLATTASELRQHGGVSLFCTEGQQWANGLTPDGDEFLPIWLTAEDAVGWVTSWPGYEVRRIAPDDLMTDILDPLDSEKMWVGLGIQRALTMCHAGWIKSLVPYREHGSASSDQTIEDIPVPKCIG